MPATADHLHLQFLRHADGIRGFIAGLTAGDLSLADDVFQEVFLVVGRRAADFREGADFVAWVRGISKRKLLEVLRQRGRSPAFDEDVLDLLAATAPLESEWSGYAGALQQCTERLAPRARELAMLRYAQDLMPTAIAERMRWTVNAVNVALSRIRRQLRECVERRLADDIR